MRIGIDARLWNETGVGRYVRNLILELSRLDKQNEYFIFVKNEDEQTVREQVPKSFEVISTKIHWHTVSEQLSFSKEIYKYHLDLMHFPYFSMPLNYNRPFVITVHDLILHHFSTGKASTKAFPLHFLKRAFYLFLTKKTAQKASAIISVSQSTKNEIVDHLKVNPAKIRVIYEGVDEKLLGSSKKDLIGNPYIFYVGNAYPHKNLNRLVSAFEKAHRNNQKLVLVGLENFFYKRLKKETEKKGVKDVVFFGQAKDSDLSSLYSSAKAFVMPSLMEGFGLPPLEAMANNCFIIASDIPALREICSGAALYFNPYDTADIADKIAFAFSTEDKSSFLKKGKERIKDFSWEKMAEETLKIYESSTSLRQDK